MKKRFVCIGGGAAGFFAAINAAEIYPELEIIILEGGTNVLQKVKVSGGGRCNVTNGCFIPNELTQFYPRGNKELLGPFHTFMTGDTMEWFESRGVELKIEDDNRVFPVSNSSQTIVDCFLTLAKKYNIQILTSSRVDAIEVEQDGFSIFFNNEKLKSNYLLIASGSNKKTWDIAAALGHTIVTPIPSLFTFNIQSTLLKDIPGVSVENATVKIKNTSLEERGPLLVTHWGISGPAVLKLSAYGAIELYKMNYNFLVEINWVSKSFQEVVNLLKVERKNNAIKTIGNTKCFSEIPKRLWIKLVEYTNILESKKWAEISNHQIEELATNITKCQLQAEGKSTFKDEFVTAGGIDLKEINFKRFESKLHKNLFFAGEVLNIDAITGGFNFQNAWTGGYIVATSLDN